MQIEDQAVTLLVFDNEWEIFIEYIESAIFYIWILVTNMEKTIYGIYGNKLVRISRSFFK